MDKATAVALLTSSNPHDRLRAARYLTEVADRGDLPRLQTALRNEDVSWVQGALRLAIQKVAKDFPSAEQGDQSVLEVGGTEIPAEQAGAIRSEATREIARRLVHEVGNILGPVRLFARQEVPDFEKSKTKRQLDRLADMIEAIDALGNAASSSKREDFELTDFVETVIADECAGFKGQVQRGGPRPLNVRGDRKLLRLAIGNGLRNAAEAASASGKEGGGRITVTWDATDVEYWISVLDDGVGLPGSGARAFDYGFTTKDGHLGMGLPTVKLAMESLGGSATLESEQTEGARLILRWPIPKESPK